VLSYRLRRIGGYANDGDADLLSCFEINVVVTGTSKSDQANAPEIKPFQNLAVDHIIHKYTHSVVTFGNPYGVGSQVDIEEF
jgi:hypothetical protein